MATDLRAAAERQIHEMNPIGMNDRKWPSAFLRLRTRVCGMVPELEEMLGFTEGALFKMGAVPLLHTSMCQDGAEPRTQ
jgi:hypothetical protein